MLKRIDDGGAWMLTNNPRAKFWETPPDGGFIGNRRYSLANIVRASTAAPHFFKPQPIEIVEGEPPALFVDGGLTPHNDPALALLLLAALPALQARMAARRRQTDHRLDRHRRLSRALLRRRAAAREFGRDRLRSLVQQISETRR